MDGARRAFFQNCNPTKFFFKVASQVKATGTKLSLLKFVYVYCIEEWREHSSRPSIFALSIS